MDIYREAGVHRSSHSLTVNQTQPNSTRARRIIVPSWGRWILLSPQESDLTTSSWFCTKLNVGVASAITAHTVPVQVLMLIKQLEMQSVLTYAMQ